MIFDKAIFDQTIFDAEAGAVPVTRLSLDVRRPIRTNRKKRRALYIKGKYKP